ncbi:hypothetical protein [Terriglobus albidus]|uniref:hypothetical protein n=1 Tax=Terriglobus albidus TaxID=1592106 RepID=UPI0021DF53C4|nr:hypothetical protein [Terriglobus albidus]
MKIKNSLWSFLLILLCGSIAHSQSVEGISYIEYDPSNQQVITYSATDLDYVAAYYYDPVVAGALYQSDDWNSPIKEGSASGNWGCGPSQGDPLGDPAASACAWGYMNASAVSGDDYGLASDHYIQCYYQTGTYDTYGNPEYNDYFGYFANGTDYSEGGGGESYPDPGYTIYVTTQLIYVGTTVVQISTYDQTPIIHSVSPPVIPDGTTSTVVVAGEHFGAFPSLNFPDTAGMSISYSSRSDTSITAQITPNGQEGTHAVEVVSTGFGGSGFLSANGTTSQSPASTLTVAGSPCTWQIVAEQTLYHINSGSNYKTATIPISVSTTPNASCPGAGTVNWTVTTVYATSAHKGASQAPQHQFTSSLNQTYNYTTLAGEGGQLTFKASFSSNGATLSKSKTVLVDGTGIPVASVKSLLTADYSAGAGGTPNLFRGVACTESKFKQFSTTTLLSDGATSVPLVLYGVNACWPNESFGGGSHIGIGMVKTSMTYAYDWTANANSAINDVFAWAKGRADTYIANTRQSHPNLPQPTAQQKEDMALIYYRWGAAVLANTYWVVNPSGNGWMKNTNATYTAYTDGVRNNLQNPTCN